MSFSSEIFQDDERNEDFLLELVLRNGIFPDFFLSQFR